MIVFWARSAAPVCGEMLQNGQRKRIYRCVCPSFSFDAAVIFVFLTNLCSSFNGLVGQTTGAHRLCFKAAQVGGQELQLKLITALFEAHLIHDKDTSDVNVLADTADSVGVMTRDEVGS